MTGTAAPPLRVVTLYPELMDVYADRGNLIALRARAAALGLRCEPAAVHLGDPLPAAADLVLIGGGQDREQRRIAPELAGHGPRLREWARQDVAFLTVCGGFQLFGHWYRTSAGEELPGVGLFDVTTLAPPPGAERCIGDVLAHAVSGAATEEAGEAAGGAELVGFENHAGRTYLGPQARPFARVEYGFGNNGADGTEGAVHREAIGTYLHGPLLPKNVWLTDRLLRAALRHRAGAGEAGTDEVGTGTDLALSPADPYAERAHRTAAAVARRRSRRAGGAR